MQYLVAKGAVLRKGCVWLSSTFVTDWGSQLIICYRFVLLGSD